MCMTGWMATGRVTRFECGGSDFRHTAVRRADLVVPIVISEGSEVYVPSGETTHRGPGCRSEELQTHTHMSALRSVRPLLFSILIPDNSANCCHNYSGEQQVALQPGEPMCVCV